MSNPICKFDELTGSARLFMDKVVEEFASRMAKDTGMTVREASDCIKELVENGLAKFVLNEQCGHISLMPSSPEQPH